VLPNSIEWEQVRAGGVGRSARPPTAAAVGASWPDAEIEGLLDLLLAKRPARRRARRSAREDTICARSGLHAGSRPPLSDRGALPEVRVAGVEVDALRDYGQAPAGPS
jgi:hypothetical protein